jgi:hypothetical protein
MLWIELQLYAIKEHKTKAQQPVPDVETFPLGSRDAVAVEEARLSYFHRKNHQSNYPISHIPDVPHKVEEADLYKTPCNALL